MFTGYISSSQLSSHDGCNLCRSMTFPRILRLTSATPFFRCRFLTAYYPSTTHISISFHHKPPHSFVGFPGSVTPGHVLLTSAVVRFLRSASIVFVVVSSVNRILLPNQSSLALVPFPATSGPGDINNIFDSNFQA